MTNQENILDIYKLSEFMELNLPEIEYLLDPIITTKSLSMIHAYRGIGKSFFAMHIAYAIATGNNFLRWRNEKKSKVLYIDGEMQSQFLQNRFAKVSNVYGHESFNSSDNLLILPADMQKSGNIDLCNNEIRTFIDDNIDDVGLIIIDNLSSLTSIDEMDAQEWRVMQNWLFSLRKRGLAVILIHHSNKGSKQRGVSNREDILDLVINLAPPTKKKKGKTKSDNNEENDDDFEDDDTFGGKCRIIFEKTRNIPKQGLFNFNIILRDTKDKSGVEWIDLDMELYQLKEAGKTYKEIEKITGVSSSTAQRIVSKIKFPQ